MLTDADGDQVTRDMTGDLIPINDPEPCRCDGTGWAGTRRLPDGRDTAVVCLACRPWLAAHVQTTQPRAARARRLALVR